MERLTFDGNFCDIAQCKELPCPYNGSCSQRKVWERLKAYEDTKLEPAMCANYKTFEDEAISKGVTFKRIVALMEADRAGRLVVPPCKVGDTVWAASGKIIKCEIDEMYLCDGGGIEYLVTFDCDGADCKRCPFNRWEQDCSGERYCECEYGCSSFKDSDIGKTIFLTSEEAKAALEATKDGN